MKSANNWVTIIILIGLMVYIIITCWERKLTGVDIMGMVIAVIIGMGMIWTVLTRGLNK